MTPYANILRATAFGELLAADAALRSYYRDFLAVRLAHERDIGRIDETHPLDHQRGRVAELLSLDAFTQELERYAQPQGDSHGPIR